MIKLSLDTLRYSAINSVCHYTADPQVWCVLYIYCVLRNLHPPYGIEYTAHLFIQNLILSITQVMLCVCVLCSSTLNNINFLCLLILILILIFQNARHLSFAGQHRLYVILVSIQSMFNSKL